MKQLLAEIKNCTHCVEHLPLGANPVMSAHPSSKIVIIGQAPGTKVHASGIPWNDPSGVQLRKWLNVDEDTFYNPEHFAIIPMGFCYPGKGSSGDLPPRPECAPLWHQRLLSGMKKVKLTLLIGQYAQQAYLGERVQRNLTETVKHHADYFPEYLPLPHPSPRNRFWMAKNEWFKSDVIPILQQEVKRHLA